MSPFSPRMFPLLVFALATVAHAQASPPTPPAKAPAPAPKQEAPAKPPAPPRLLAAPPASPPSTRPVVPSVPGTRTSQGSTQAPPPRVPFEEALAKLKREGKGATAQRLQAATNAAKAEVKQKGKGHVVVGRVVLVGGPGKLEQLIAPARLLEDGWFVAQVEGPKARIPLRLHGYEAGGVSLDEPSPKDVIHVGEVPLRPLPPERLGTVKGRVTLADPKASLQAYAFIVPSEVTAATTSAGEAPPAARLELKPQKDGSFQLGGLTPRPARYELWFKAPGHEPQSRSVIASPGATQDLGEIRLGKPSRLRVRYMLSSTPPPFQNAKVQEAQLEEGQSFKADPAMKGATFVFHQRPVGDRLQFSTQPARLAQVGKGTLESASAKAPDGLKFAVPFEVGFEPGTLYLLDHRAAGQWVLFQIEPTASAAK